MDEQKKIEKEKLLRELIQRGDKKLVDKLEETLNNKKNNKK